MPNEIVTALIGLAGALIGAGAATITTVTINRNERTKFARERVWDLRREAYTKIISALGPAQQISEHIAQSYDDDPHGYDAGKPVKEAMAEFTKHYRAARDFYYGFRLVLSREFAVAYQKLLDGMRDISDNPNLIPPESASMVAKCVKGATEELIEIAQLEIATVPERSSPILSGASRRTSP